MRENVEAEFMRVTSTKCLLTLQPKWLTIVRLPQKPKAFKCHHPETDGIPFRSCTASKRMAPRRRPQQRKSGWGRGWVHQKSGTTLSVKQPSQVKDHLYIYMLYALLCACALKIRRPNRRRSDPLFQGRNIDVRLPSQGQGVSIYQGMLRPGHQAVRRLRALRIPDHRDT